MIYRSIFLPTMRGRSIRDHLWVLQRTPNATADELLSTNLFLDLGTGFFNQVSTQILKIFKIIKDIRVVHGSATIMKTRLFVRILPLQINEGALLIATLLTAFIVLRPSTSSQIAADLAKLTGSAVSLRSLKDGNTTSDNHVLMNADLEALVRRRNKISKPENNSSAASRQDAFRRRGAMSTWWTPTVSHRAARLASLVFVASLIVVLQVLLKISHDHSGLAETTTSGNQALLWTLIPAIVLASLALYV